MNEWILYSFCAIKLSQSANNVDFLFSESVTWRNQCEIDWLGSLTVIISPKHHLGSTKYGFGFVFVYSNIWFIESIFGMFSVIVHYFRCSVFIVHVSILIAFNRTMFHKGVNYHGNSIRTSVYYWVEDTLNSSAWFHGLELNIEQGIPTAILFLIRIGVWDGWVGIIALLNYHVTQNL